MNPEVRDVVRDYNVPFVLREQGAGRERLCSHPASVAAGSLGFPAVL